MFKRLFAKRQSADQALQKQANELYGQAVQFLDVELFDRARAISSERYPDVDTDGVAAHIKLYCTGEGENSAQLTSMAQMRRPGVFLAIAT